MSTNATIARPADPSGPDAAYGWSVGVYVHYDGYPTGVGAAIFDALAAHDGDVEATRRFLIDDETHGWSSLAGADFSLPPTWSEGHVSPSPPQSYRFRRGEVAQPHLLAKDGPIGTWLYVLHDDHLEVVAIHGSVRASILWSASPADVADALSNAERALHDS